MNLQKLRKAKKLTQKRLASELNISQQSVAKWENGQSLPRAELLPKIAELLECTVDELLREEENA